MLDTVTTVLVSVIIALVLQVLALAVYRLYLSPIARLGLPGPKVPALTLWYEFYYDVVKKGSLVWKIKEWHEQYDPIIRINPYEIHIQDPDFYNELYAPAGSVKIDKYPWWTKLAGCPGSIFATDSRELHRLRRAPLAIFFSKKAITEFEPVVKEKVEKLCARLAAVDPDEIIRIDCAYLAITIDVICQYCFGEDRRYIDWRDFAADWKAMLNAAWEQFGLIKQFPSLPYVLRRLPRRVAAVLDRQTSLLLEWQDIVRRHVEPILVETPGAQQAKPTQRSIYRTLRDSDLPPSERTLQRLCDEGQVFLGAGSETTGKALAIITFHILSNPYVRDRLRSELADAMPNPDDFPTVNLLEKLPYLRAVIQEGLRLTHGILERLPRVRREPLVYRQYTIPAGIPVSQTGYFILSSPDIFPSPTMFDPSRWLTNDRNLEQYLINFGRGTRSCIGIDLAYAALYLTVAAVFRRFSMELFEPSAIDVDVKHNYFVAGMAKESKGVRLKNVGKA